MRPPVTQQKLKCVKNLTLCTLSNLVQHKYILSYVPTCLWFNTFPLPVSANVKQTKVIKNAFQWECNGEQ
jgi:hypothetical protein